MAADTDWAAVRAAYRRLIRAAHPDVAGAASTAGAARLNEAYAVLLRLRSTPPAPSAPPSRAPTRHGPPPPPRTRSVDAGTLLLSCPPDEAFARVVEAGHDIGEITYVDRSCAIVEVVVDVEGEACSLVVTFQGRAHGTEAFCTLEALERVASLDPSAVVDRLVDALTAG